jgi:casein kinase II subunit beta
MNMILDPESPDDEDLEDQRFLDIYQEAMDLYGLIHNRFIQSPKGLNLMREKFYNGVFGVCPRVLCGGQQVIPIGMSENLRHSKIRIYCPKCEDVYNPKKKCSDVDGAYFGTSFPHILMQTHPEIVPKEEPVQFIPRIYGFKLYKKKGSAFYDQNRKFQEIALQEENNDDQRNDDFN